MKHVAIYGMKFTRQSLDYVYQVHSECQKRGWNVLMEKDMLAHLTSKYDFFFALYYVCYRPRFY